jgi:hypothetical protein
LLTLNQIISQITDLANAHYQIAEVGTGTLAELQSKPDRLYPLLWLSNEGGSLDQNYKIDNIRLTMFGRVIAGEEGQDDDASELEVLSDMQLILLDFLNYFHQQHGQEYVTDKAATLEHFTERTNDRTAGYSCVLELKQFYDWNKCQIPQSGASIPPSVDGLTLYDFCDQSVIDRLTATQVACLEAELCGACADATVQLNGTTVGTIPSGDTDSFTVNLDGSPSGSWDGTAWQVTSPPCDDATIELNGVEMTTIPSGDTENISVRQSSGATEVGSKQGVHWRIDDSAISINGSPVADVKAEDPLDIDVTQGGSPVGSWNGSAWIVPPCPTPASIAVSASDTNPNLGGSVTITATPSNITPVSYTFYLPKVNGEYETVTQASNVYVWTAEGNGTENVLVAAVDALGAMAHSCVEVDVIFPFVYEQYAGMSTSFGIFKASSAYAGDWAQVQRQSDGAYLEVGWVNGCIADFQSLRDFAGLSVVQITILYDSTGNGNHWTQTNSTLQIEMANYGGVQNYQNSLNFKNNDLCNQTTVGTNNFISQARVDLYGCMDATTGSDSSVWLFMRGTNANNSFMLLGQSGSATTSINAAFGTPSYYLNGSLASWSNRGAVYSALIGTGYNTISMIGGNTTSSNWSAGGFLGQANTFDMIGNYGTLWMWTVDTSANRTAIEAKLNVLKSISID